VLPYVLEYLAGGAGKGRRRFDVIDEYRCVEPDP